MLEMCTKISLQTKLHWNSAPFAVTLPSAKTIFSAIRGANTLGNARSRTMAVMDEMDGQYMGGRQQSYRLLGTLAYAYAHLIESILMVVAAFLLSKSNIVNSAYFFCSGLFIQEHIPINVQTYHTSTYNSSNSQSI